MDIKEYIQSGIVEQYVLGLANAEEAAELELLRVQYPELDKSIINFEETFEKQLLSNPVQPPANLKALIEQELFGEEHKAKVVETNFPAAATQNISTWKWFAAACIILLIGSTVLNFYFYSTYKNSRQEYEALFNQRNTLQANNASYKQDLESYKESLNLFQDTSLVHVEMKGLPGKENNIATVLWNKKSNDVYIYSASMQHTPSGKQYQLWAIVDGKPVDAGVIDNCTGVCKMKNISNAQAFAITLEKEGGSPAPTMSAMYVLGKVS